LAFSAVCEKRNRNRVERHKDTEYSIGRADLSMKQLTSLISGVE
jgi:hypothetical protein